MGRPKKVGGGVGKSRKTASVLESHLMTVYGNQSNEYSIIFFFNEHRIGDPLKDEDSFKKLVDDSIEKCQGRNGKTLILEDGEKIETIKDNLKHIDHSNFSHIGTFKVKFVEESE